MPTKSEKLPALQFYPADWRKDPGVQSLNFFERGFWFELLCIMHESDERGVLLLNGEAMSVEIIARLTGLDKQTATKTLTTLLSRGVADRRGSDNAVYSRRMVRDEEIRQIRKKAGKLGGNPGLVKQKQSDLLNQKSTPSSSSSSSTSVVYKKNGVERFKENL